ncbi:MAG: MBL fold metallo-hydrolase [Rhodocyclaceae bacterium]|jgi:glyoxylase-like metal-dependent hydrolase (beta-lactamase superfamily II)/8-oxo-dGTP pyrophosphatase MutT (NUDIX family)|nr:MBL fold metallo-hydrolase [Rhodocyclaceae bacterium]
MATTPLTPRPAATLILTRDGTDGIEVLLMQRTQQADFIAGAYVFPGGAVDSADHCERLLPHCLGHDDASASQLLGIQCGGLAYAIAAIRECFEEAGLLLACNAGGDFVDMADDSTLQDYAALRRRLNSGELSLAELCWLRNLRLPLDRLAYFAHWITPPGATRRYDTRFYVACAPERQAPSHDDSEMIDHLWIRPGEALQRQKNGQFKLVYSTITILKALSGFANTTELMAHARELRDIPTRVPRRALYKTGSRVLIQGHPAYAEICKLDPQGEGGARCEILPGEVTRLSARVRRIAAPNAGMMTGPGTNTYLLGSGDDIAVLDPGPASPEHVQTLLNAAGGRIRWILATHTHPDHSPAALLLQQATGAKLLGVEAPVGLRQDESFRPDVRLEHGQRLQLGNCTLRVIHTPGHASNHLCFMLEEEKLLFTGDHIMQGSTVVISPPDGCMSAYLRSLELLQQEDIEYLAPAHGFLMDNPLQMIERLQQHRLKRERQILEAVQTLGCASIEKLRPLVYRHVATPLQPAATRSLLAHLLRLVELDLVIEKDGLWSLRNAACAGSYG